MFGLMDRIPTATRNRRVRAKTRAAVGCEGLEGRELLSAGFGFPSYGGGGFGMRMADFAPGGGRAMAMRIGGDGFGFGGGSRVESALLAPLLASSGTQSGSPTYMAMNSSTVQQAMQTLQTDLTNDTPSGAQPTFASLGALEDDLSAVRKGTLSGSAAQTQIASDQAAVLTSMGLTQTQITQIQTDAQAVVTAIQSSASSSTSSTSTSTTSTTSTGSTSSSDSSTVKSAFQTLQSDLKSDTPSGAQPTHASIGAVLDDLDAIRKGTLTGSAAVTKVQTDAGAVLSSMGLTQTQISQIQSDQQAVQSAEQASSSASTSTSSSTTASTLQSVSPYLVSIPGVSGFGMRGMGGPHGGMRAFFRY
jgi:hypothetical protein